MDTLKRLEEHQAKATKDDNAYLAHIQTSETACIFEVIGYSVVTSGNNRRYISPMFDSVTEVFAWLRNRLDIAKHIGEKYVVSREISIN